jgi:LmbE family N-acetylglucosaminyl deacetylase
MKLEPEGWDEKKKILVILAHPDDPEFFCGATLARWSAAGHEIHYLLLTKGDKGSDDPEQTPEEISRIRVVEQKAAGDVLGIKSIEFMSYPDGYVVPDLDMRKKVTRYIRIIQPNVIVTSDPTYYFSPGSYINHPDHRAAGQVAVDAYFPAAGNLFFFPELISEEHLMPHNAEEFWISLTDHPNTTIDVTEFWPVKIEALHRHASQIGEVTAFDKRMKSRHNESSTEDHPRYEETFRRLVLK